MKQNSLLPRSGDNIKKYINNKKVEKYSQGNKNTVWLYVIDALIVLVFISTLCYIYLVNDNQILKYIGYGIIVIFGAFVIVRILTILLAGQNESAITKLVLISEDGRGIKSWNIKGKVSLLVGRNTKNNEVDIDLSNVEYSELISRQHAVLNYAEGAWYIEDIGSSYGTGLKKVNEERFKLDIERLYELSLGDIIYIANTKIMVK
ncbi:MAG: FHA domain-containing protein [Clostridium sp.]|jgi:hypothetical protein|nr:FHA domain-containing protein [Clostridium sp.]